jgi:putative ABC transport system substrate-binding protein
MRRREFLIAGLSAAACPRGSHAQQPPVIGWLHGGSQEAYADTAALFRQALSEAGYVEGKNITIEYRWANAQYDLLPALAADLVHRNVTLLVAITPVAALAAKHATTSIPIVFSVGSDPIRDKIVDSLSHPSKNITGATIFSNLLSTKRFELLHRLVPDAKRFSLLLNPKNANAEFEINEAQEAASNLGLQLIFLKATNEGEIDKAFSNLTQEDAEAVIVAADTLFTDQRRQIAELALRNSIPTSFIFRIQAEAGGLMSYGANVADQYRVMGNYVGRILNGEKPADLPVQQPTKFELVLNLKTAKAIGIEVPNSIQLLADEVIE